MMEPRSPLKPLTCEKCGGSVPLGDRADATCPYCSNTFPVPAKYIELRRTRRGIEQDRTLAQSLYRKLGRPPGPLGRLLSRLHGCLLLVVFFFYLQTILNLIAELVFQPYNSFHYHTLHLNAQDTAGPFAATVLLVLPLFLLLAGPFLVLGLLRQRVRVLGPLQAALAAGEPEKPGGPATCHRCGAPLDVPDGALGVECVYCKTHNLVALPAKWVEGMRHRARQLSGQLEEALAAYRKASRKIQFNLAIQVAIFGFIAMIALTVGYNNVKLRYPGDWSRGLESRRGLTLKGQELPYGETVTLQPDPYASYWPGAKNDPVPEQGMTAIYLPLRFEEVVTLTGPVRGHLLMNRAPQNYTKSLQLESFDLEAGESWSYKAPAGAWYRLDLDLDKEAGPVELRLDVAAQE